MKHLVLFALVMVGMLAVVLTATLVYARGDKEALLANDGFALCDGYPCYDGITPGLTTWEQARHIFSQAARERPNRNFSVLTLDEDDAPISFYSHGDMVGFIGANYWKAKHPVTIGELAAIFGVPCAVRISVDGQGKPLYIQALHYPTTTIFVGYVGRLTPQAAINLVNVYKPSIGNQCYAGADSQTVIAPWVGFRIGASVHRAAVHEHHAGADTLSERRGLKPALLQR
jgi:hypothetical protein